MIVESLLPLGKLDPGLREPDTPLDIRRFAELARVAEDVGLGAVLVEETKDDPFQLLALGAAVNLDDRSRHVGGNGVPSEPDRDGHVGMVVAEAVGGPVRARSRHAGPRPHRTSVRGILVGTGTVDA